MKAKTGGHKEGRTQHLLQKAEGDTHTTTEILGTQGEIPGAHTNKHTLRAPLLQREEGEIKNSAKKPKNRAARQANRKSSTKQWTLMKSKNQTREKFFLDNRVLRVTKANSHGMASGDATLTVETV